MPEPNMFLPNNERKNMIRSLNRLGLRSYDHYLRSDWWLLTRRRLARGRCEVCGSPQRLVLHHMTYANLGREGDSDVCTLCRRCHRDVHRSTLRGGSLYVEEAFRGRSQANKRHVSALEVSCPACGAMPTHHCRLPSGRVRLPEHKERRRKLDDRNKLSKQHRRARAKRARAEALRISIDQLDRVESARSAEFPLQALRDRAT